MEGRQLYGHYKEWADDDLTIFVDEMYEICTRDSTSPYSPPAEFVDAITNGHLVPFPIAGWEDPMDYGTSAMLICETVAKFPPLAAMWHQQGYQLSEEKQARVLESCLDFAIPRDYSQTSLDFNLTEYVQLVNISKGYFRLSKFSAMKLLFGWYWTDPMSWPRAADSFEAEESVDVFFKERSFDRMGDEPDRPMLSRQYCLLYDLDTSGNLPFALSPLLCDIMHWLQNSDIIDDSLKFRTARELCRDFFENSTASGSRTWTLLWAQRMPFLAGTTWRDWYDLATYGSRGESTAIKLDDIIIILWRSVTENGTGCLDFFKSRMPANDWTHSLHLIFRAMLLRPFKVSGSVSGLEAGALRQTH